MDFITFNQVKKDKVNYVKYRDCQFKIWYDHYGPKWCCEALNFEFAVTHCNSIKEVKESIDWELDV